MKKRIVAIIALLGIVFTSLASLTACGLPVPGTEAEEEAYLTPDDYEPTYYTSEAEIPEDAYYIVHETKNETRYYPLYSPEHTYTDVNSDPTGFDPSRVTWVNYNLDEGLIPTMYAGDKMIYKSSTYIPTTYSLEKFFDNGYTLGVCGLRQDLSGNYKYTSSGNDGDSYVMTTSDAAGFDSLNADSIYFVAVGEDRVSPMNVSMSGTISGLELMKSYDCDIRTGTEKIAATLLCNVHYFSSAETYLFGSFTFITDIIAQLNIPEYASTGYYTINGPNNFFRYVADEKAKDYHKLSEDDYNSTIYTYDEDGLINGTSIGLVFDQDTGFLVASTTDETTYTGNTAGSAKTYQDIINGTVSGDKVITNPTKLTPSVNGNYSGTYVVSELSDPVIEDAKNTYTLTAASDSETITLKYQKTASNIELVAGNEYMFTFKNTTDDFDGYMVISATEVTDNAEETETSEDEPAEEEATDTEEDTTEDQSKR